MKPTWYLKISENYVIFSPFGKDAPCDTVGVDVGTRHLGLAGIHSDEKRKFPMWTWVALVSFPEANLHTSVDKITDTLYEISHFDWLRNANHYRIEQQVQINPKARAMACVLRTLFRVFQKQRNVADDVEFVHGELKYAIAPLYSKDARKDPIRKKESSGSRNKPLRKKLGENDAKHLLKENGEKYMLRFLNYLSGYADQLHDMTDSYLIGRSMYESNLKIDTKRKTRKTNTESNI